MSITNFDTFFRNAPPQVDVATIRRYWQATGSTYDVSNWLLPLPPWRQRPYEQSGHEAWDIVRHDLAQTDADRAFCIYLHVPFCFGKCGFCDSYSFKLGSHKDARIQEYTDRLCYELELWSQQSNLSQRPVSTVHMGGGTPTFLGEAALTQIVDCCQRHFSITPTTEWALESTTQELTPSMIQTMHELGYRRLHIGVQSMEDDVRAAIGRKTRAQTVLEKIHAAKSLGWIVSVDLICGLPHQTLRGFIEGIETLAAAGINGFSLYDLLIYPQNRRWAIQHNLNNRERHLPNYWMLLAGADLLERHGFHKNLFNHWADKQDQNIYFTFPTRGEDLLAIGTIADGVFGNYHYRHPTYASYMKEARAGRPGLEGGLRRESAADQAHPLAVAVLAGQIPANLVSLLREAGLLARWLDCQMVNTESDGSLKLTINGTWFAGNLIAEIAQAFYTVLPDTRSPATTGD